MGNVNHWHRKHGENDVVTVYRPARFSFDVLTQLACVARSHAQTLPALDRLDRFPERLNILTKTQKLPRKYLNKYGPMVYEFTI